MKRSKDYTLLALLIPFIISVLACSCGHKERYNRFYNEQEAQKAGCTYEGGECPNVQKYMREYQLELLPDSTRIWQYDREVATIHYSASIDSILLLDNQ